MRRRTMNVSRSPRWTAQACIEGIPLSAVASPSPESDVKNDLGGTCWGCGAPEAAVDESDSERRRTASRRLNSWIKAVSYGDTSAILIGLYKNNDYMYVCFHP